jgi:hypothetical protein
VESINNTCPTADRVDGIPASRRSGHVVTTPALTSTTSYWVQVSNANGNANSITATISIGVAPTITTLAGERDHIRT